MSNRKYQIIQDASTGIFRILNPVERSIYNIDSSVSTTPAGNLKQQTNGERFKWNCEARLASSVWRDLRNMLVNQSEYYLFTPAYIDRADYDFAITFPIRVVITINDFTYNNGEIIHVNYDVQGTGYYSQ